MLLQPWVGLLLLLLLLLRQTEGFFTHHNTQSRSSMMLLSSRLHGILELQHGNQLIGDADLPPDLNAAMKTTKGREAVAEGAKSIQRLQLMLDRSDGRPDLTSDVLAEKYGSFLSTCLRTPGAAWTASLGPMDYVGVRLSEHVTTTKADLKELDLKSLFKQMASCLIDLDVSAPVPSALQAEDAHRKVLDLSLAIVRVATRYAILADQLEGAAPAPPFSLRLLTRGDVGAFEMISLDALRTTMQLDFQFSPDGIIMSPDGTALEVRSQDVQAWRNNNLL